MKNIIIFAGQSNMVGRRNKFNALPENVQKFPPRTQLYHKKLLNKWKEKYYGPELGCIIEILKGDKKKDEYIIFKSAEGGTNLAYDWNPNGTSKSNDIKYKGPLYPKMIKQYEKMLKVLNKNNESYQVIGFLWMQGESDASHKNLAVEYENNLKNLINKIRKDTDTPELPVIIGKIISQKRHNEQGVEIQPHRDIINNSINRIAKFDENVTSFGTNDLRTFPDRVHFNNKGMIELGRRFGRELLKNQ